MIRLRALASAAAKGAAPLPRGRTIATGGSSSQPPLRRPVDSSWELLRPSAGGCRSVAPPSQPHPQEQATTRAAAPLALRDDARPFAANSVPCAKDGKIGVLGKPQRALVAVTNKDGKVGVLGRPQRALVAHPFTLLPPSPFVGARGRSTSSLPSDHQESPAEDDDNEQTAKTSSSLQDVGEQDKISKIGAGAGDVNKIGTGAGGEGARRVDGAADYKIKDVVAAVNSNKSASHTADNTSGDDRTTDGPGARRRRHRRRRPQPHDDMLLRRILSYSSSMSRKLDDLRSLPRDVAVDMKKTRSKIASLRWIIPLTTGISLFVGGSLTFILTIKFGIPFVVGKFIEESSKVLESIDAK